jgi:hypothetical protein
LGQPLAVFAQGFAMFALEGLPIWVWSPGDDSGSGSGSDNHSQGQSEGGGGGGGNASGPWGPGPSPAESRMYTCLFWTSACLAVTALLLTFAFFTRWNRAHNAAAFACVTALTMASVGVARTSLQVRAASDTD